jgi:protease-4
MKKLALSGLIILLITGASALSLQNFMKSDSGEVGIIQLSGTITPEASSFSSGITPDRLRDLNQRAKTQNLDAVVYEINSGGGAVVASKDLKRNIEAMNIPTVCRFRDTAASGGYLAALGCDRIVADSGTITGSIGVSSSYLEFSDLMDKIGVSYVNITAGERKSIGSQYQEPTEEEKQILEEKAQIIGEEFLNMVDRNRNLTEQERAEVGTGEIFLGSEAKKLGLVDSLGGRKQAIESAENLTGMELDPVAVQQTQDFNLLSLFLQGMNVNLQGSPLEASL